MANVVIPFDIDAIHVNAAGEIDGITVKTTPVNADLVVIESAADGFAKRKATLGSLPGGGGGGGSRARAIATVTAAIAANVLIEGPGGPGSANIDIDLLDYSALTFRDDVEIWINGVLVEGGPDDLANHDVYASGVTAEEAVGAFLSEFPLIIGDKIQMFTGGGGGGLNQFVAVLGGRYTGGAAGEWISFNVHGFLDGSNAATVHGTGADPNVSASQVGFMVPVNCTIREIKTTYSATSASTDGEIRLYKYDRTNDSSASVYTALGTDIDLGPITTANNTYIDTQTGLSIAVAGGEAMRLYKRHTSVSATVFINVAILLEVD